MNDYNSKEFNIENYWGFPLQPATCPSCDAAFLIPASKGMICCPACFKSQMRYRPTVIRPEPPELLLEFSIKPKQINESLTHWLKGVWLHPKDLCIEVLMKRLTPTFIPIWLVDSKVTGKWESQMGYEYQVASSQEVYSGGTWTTKEIKETRIRWAPRIGTIERIYQNLQIPAMDEHNQLMNNLGKFVLETVTTYSPEKLRDACIRVPNQLPETALPQVISGLNRLVAIDCQIASDAQHVDEFSIEAEYLDQNWTQLLLPVYTTGYQDEKGVVYPILIHGQSGKIFGVKRASQQLAGRLSLGLVGIALVCFMIGLLLASGVGILPLLSAFSLSFFFIALIVGIFAPLPAFWAWNFNRLKNNS